ncbi:hypothetical protein [Streptomyces sp. NRRL S-350]|uniref:hypothetical protein n=1 Tax=Streptomyces sp. NRRL S-350 TaxID=1463902 RepID=UPI0004C136CE|nr:hypothetical protein [Streptomyces sp. NRRL S-350]
MVSDPSFTIYIAAFITLIPAAAAAQREVARRGWRRAPQAVVAISIAVIVLSVIHLMVFAWITYQWFAGQCSSTQFWMAVLGSMLGGFAYALVPEPKWRRRTE